MGVVWSASDTCWNRDKTFGFRRASTKIICTKFALYWFILWLEERFWRPHCEFQQGIPMSKFSIKSIRRSRPAKILAVQSKHYLRVCSVQKSYTNLCHGHLRSRHLSYLYIVQISIRQLTNEFDLWVTHFVYIHQWNTSAVIPHTWMRVSLALHQTCISPLDSSERVCNSEDAKNQYHTTLGKTNLAQKCAWQVSLLLFRYLRVAPGRHVFPCIRCTTHAGNGSVKRGLACCLWQTAGVHQWMCPRAQLVCDRTKIRNSTISDSS